jgi:hypothetical protein
MMKVLEFGKWRNGNYVCKFHMVGTGKTFCILELKDGRLTVGNRNANSVRIYQ